MDTKQKKREIKGLPVKELSEEMIRIREQKFRGEQIFDWLYNHMSDSFEEMANIPKALRRKLDKIYSIFSLELIEVQESEQTDTKKYLFKTYDGHYIETVLIPSGKDSATLCVSTQIGCPLGCKFCATGYLGLKRNLTAGEIVDQYVLTAKQTNRDYIRNIVFMGMGEPFLNYNETLKAIKIFTAEFNKNISRTRVTLSTSGVAPQIRKLTESGLRIKLALSLHAAFDDLRVQIMPIAEKYKLKETLRACRNYAKKTNTRITFEYTLFKNFNDRREDQIELVKICKTMPSKINLIPYNSIAHITPEGIAAKLEPATIDEMENFASAIRKKNITVMIRDTQGNDIFAACGQLAATKKENNEKT